jgi:hypothetical protein
VRHRELAWIGAVTIAALVAIMALGLVFREPAFHWDVAAIPFISLLLVLVIAARMPTDVDGRWLPGVVVGAFVLKIFGAIARWWVLVDLYGGVGDAAGYHGRGIAYASVWRSFHVPHVEVGSAGTTFVSQVTALLYVPHIPSNMLGGFFIFATVAFCGQLLLYAAFRKAVPGARLGWYAVGILLLPSMVFWPSSIGKEALMIAFIGVTAYASARVLSDYRIRWAVVAGAGIVGAAAIRSHIAALLAAAITAAMLLGKAPRVHVAQVRRLVLLGVSVAGLIAAVSTASLRFGVDLTQPADVDPFISELQRRTQQGGSAVSGQAIRSLADVPAGVLRVVFRPLPNEAVSAQGWASALESVALLVVAVLLLPAMIRHARRLRSYPYLLFSLVFTVGFIWGFSAIFNLGILARQRTQMLPFLVALLVGLGGRIRAPSTEPERALEPT